MLICNKVYFLSKLYSGILTRRNQVSRRSFKRPQMVHWCVSISKWTYSVRECVTKDPKEWPSRSSCVTLESLANTSMKEFKELQVTLLSLVFDQTLTAHKSQMMMFGVFTCQFAFVCCVVPPSVLTSRLLTWSDSYWLVQSFGSWQQAAQDNTDTILTK